MVVKHEIGHLPFEADVTDVLVYGEENRITVSCGNVLHENTIPQGKVDEVLRSEISNAIKLSHLIGLLLLFIQ